MLVFPPRAMSPQPLMAFPNAAFRVGITLTKKDAFVKALCGPSLVQFSVGHVFSLNILLRVFSIPGGECVSIVLAGLAFFEPPPCNIAGRLLLLFFFYCSPAILNYIGAFSARPDFRYTNFFSPMCFKLVNLNPRCGIFFAEPDFRYTNFPPNVF